MNSATDAKLREAIKRHWGYEEYLPLQQPAMHCVMEHHDSVIVLPTGGGKSLCFQAPAVCHDGLAVVVSPLISLMMDQVQALAACGISAACINSMMSFDERRHVAELVKNGELKLLYVAPERLVMPKTLDFLAASNLSFVAIDEAHCISSWGHDFRPEYRDLRILKQRFPELGVHAYTATATETVRRDIAEQLALEDPAYHVGSFDRPNLTYKVARRRDGLNQVRSVIDRHPNESGIVYCISRKEVDRMSALLNEMGYKALPYHAGMSDEDRKQNQTAFIEERTDVVVATVAFGMGIDKSNVRYVVHAGMPKALEAYQQETGRAGRDGLEAECCMFYSGSDFLLWKRLLEDAEADPTAIDGAIQSLNAMYNYCTGVECRHRALVRYFGGEFTKTSCDACDVCAGELDEVNDPLVTAQKVLSCVVRVDQRYGGDYVSLVLKGSRDQRILQNRHDELSTYGLLADHEKRTIRDWVEQLVSQGHLEKTGEFNVLQLTASGREVLKGNVTPRLLQPVKRRKQKQDASVDSWEGVDRALFDNLRDLRREYAVQASVPAYVIFSDAALRDMARRRPSTLDGFLEVRGVGEKKCTDYGEDFVAHIVEYCKQTDTPTDITPPETPQPSRASGTRSKRKGSLAAARESFQYFDAGHSIEEIANRMRRAPATVHGYLQHYIAHNRITDPTHWVAPDTANKVTTAIEKVGDVAEKPIHEQLAGSVSYDEIRIVMACHTARQQ